MLSEVYSYAKKFAHQYPVNYSDDLVQKTLVSLDSLQPLLKKSSEKDRQRIVYSVMKNKAIDYSRVESRRKTVSLEDGLIQTMCKSGMQFEISSALRLKERILDWGRSEGEDTYRLLSEMISPSERLYQEYEKTRSKFSSKNKDQLSPTTVCRLMNYPKQKWIHQSRSLWKHLQNSGFID